MKIKWTLIKVSFCFIISFVFFGCGNKVVITRTYIYSSEWKRGQYQGFRIGKIKLLDTTISIYNKEFYESDLNKHVIDSSFCYGAGRNHGNGNNMPKIYFDKESNLFIWYKCGNIIDHKKSIGVLELNTWYIIIGLKGTTDYYVYIDKEVTSHVYSLGSTNW